MTDGGTHPVPEEAEKGPKATGRMVVNPEPLAIKPIPVCRDCGMRAPWCKCGSMNYTTTRVDSEPSETPT